jgi:hypothetical protein
MKTWEVIGFDEETHATFTKDVEAEGVPEAAAVAQLDFDARNEGKPVQISACVLQVSLWEKTTAALSVRVMARRLDVSPGLRMERGGA